jgi:hypothetical protein
VSFKAKATPASSGSGAVRGGEYSVARSKKVAADLFIKHNLGHFIHVKNLKLKKNYICVYIRDYKLPGTGITALKKQSQFPQIFVTWQLCVGGLLQSTRKNYSIQGLASYVISQIPVKLRL